MHLEFYSESFQQLAYSTLADWQELQPNLNKAREGGCIYMKLPNLALNASAFTRHWWGVEIYYPVNFSHRYRLALVPPLAQSHDLLLISVARKWLGCLPCLVHTDTFTESPGPVGNGLRSAFLGWVLTDSCGQHFRSNAADSLLLLNGFPYQLCIWGWKVPIKLSDSSKQTFQLLACAISSLCGLHDSKLLVQATSQPLLHSGHLLHMILPTHWNF